MATGGHFITGAAPDQGGPYHFEEGVGWGLFPKAPPATGSNTASFHWDTLLTKLPIGFAVGSGGSSELTVPAWNTIAELRAKLNAIKGSL